VYKQSVRRRRAVLGLLVAASLILLTAYFGEGAGGGLHAIQRGVMGVVAPIQEGANRALKPFRDLAGWFGDTLDAKGEVEKLREQRDALRKQAIGAQTARRENEQLRAMVNLDRQPELENYTPVTARVIGRSPTVWYATINIDKGSSAGLRVDQPVVNGEGLVGKVTAVTRGAAQVTLISDHTSGVSAKVNASRGVTGVVKPAVGNPSDLLLDFVSKRTAVTRNQVIVTAGSRAGRLESLFPPGIPIGVVSRIEANELELFQRVHVRPFADLRRLDFVQVLTPGGRAGEGRGGEPRAEVTP
jgi:rod shape-determining protein MreC